MSDVLFWSLVFVVLFWKVVVFLALILCSALFGEDNPNVPPNW
jgi:hypothetical protein